MITTTSLTFSQDIKPEHYFMTGGHNFLC